jgi:uncharacterized protein YkwD
MSLSRCRMMLLAGAAAALLAAAPARAANPLPLPTGQTVDPCPGSDVLVSAGTAAPLRGVVLCLMNRQRAALGLRALRSNAVLGAAAGQYAQLMVVQRFFDHVSPTGSTLRSRVARAGYLRGSYFLGEDIATGSGTDATPAAIVDAWMNSPPHRRNILEPTFRDAGMGVVPGSATDDAPDGATYVVDFGRRDDVRAATRARSGA